MDENEWFESDDPKGMYAAVWNRIDQRKQRLFACACVRSVWHNLRDERLRAIVELSEEVADGRASLERLERATGPLTRSVLDFSSVLTDPSVAAMAAAYQLGRGASFINQAIALTLLSAAPCVPTGTPTGPTPPDPEAQKAHARLLAHLFRDTVGNPFRPVALHLDWLAWDGGTVRRLAETMYEERRYQDLPVLADALEEAGCDEPEVLAHLRGGGIHARGCWALDLARGIV
jgi:hypothetical protein